MQAPAGRAHTVQARAGGGRAARAFPAIAGYPAAAGAVVVVGTLLRLRQWWPGRSLWFDEIELAVNLRDRGFARLLQPLSQQQAAPVGWLWLERLGLVLHGTGERTLRLVPLVFGAALLVVLAWAARQVLRPPAALAVLVLAAVQQYLVYYSNELKQYSSEAFWVTVLVALGIALVRRPPAVRLSLVYWLLALVGTTMSMMALPVGGVIGAIVAVHALRGPAGARAATRFALPGTLWLAGGLALYLTTMRGVQNSAYMRWYWARAYPSRPLTDAPATLRWAVHAGRTLLGIPFDVRYGWAFALLLLAGAVTCVRRNGVAVLAVLLAPPAIGAVATALSKYPFYGRLALYCVPAVLLLLGCAVDGPYPRAVPAGWPARLDAVRVLLAGVLLLLVAVPWVATAVAQARRPANPVEYRQALAYIAASRRPGDALVGTSLSDRPQLWYGPRLLGLDQAVILRPGRRGEGCRPDDVAAVLRGHPRVWLFELTDWEEPTNPVLQARLQQFGRQVEARTFAGTRVLLYDLTQPPGGPVDEHRYLSPAGYDCLTVSTVG